MSEPIAWVANVLFVVGAYLVARRRRLGFVPLAAANVLYCAVAAMLGTYALLALSAVLAWINVVGIVNWKKLET